MGKSNQRHGVESPAPGADGQAHQGDGDDPEWGLVAKVTFPRDTELERMSREELLEEYDDELNVRGQQRDDWVVCGRRRLINHIISMGAEREADLDELLALRRSELLAMAKDAGLEGVHRLTKLDLATHLLVGY
jgi:hypothetical protein